MSLSDPKCDCAWHNGKHHKLCKISLRADRVRNVLTTADLNMQLADLRRDLAAKDVEIKDLKWENDRMRMALTKIANVKGGDGYAHIQATYAQQALKGEREK